MTRQQRDPNPLGVALTVGTTIALCAGILLYRHPELILWLVALFGACITVGALLVAGEAREEAKGLRDQLRAEREAHAAQRGDVVPVPLLRLIPTQRDGEHDRLAMSRDEWDAIERETREL